MMDVESPTACGNTQQAVSDNRYPAAGGGVGEKPTWQSIITHQKIRHIISIQ